MDTFEALKDLRFYQYFCEISAIPRGSGNEKAISDYLVTFAKANGLAWERDGADNVVIKKEASFSYGNKPAVILQCHMDMVCVSGSDSSHDFLRNGIIPLEQDGFLMADRTTLGADNGIGMAYLLAILKEEHLRHPKLIAIFTTGEETGLKGMAALDASELEADRMINLDGEGEGILFASCAGGERYEMKIPLKWESIHEAEQRKCYKLLLSGFSGGHSGIDIDKGRANAVILLARFLKVLVKKRNYHVCALEGGSKENAIPRDASACIWMNEDEAAQALEEIREFEQQILLEYAKKEPAFTIRLEECNGKTMPQKELDILAEKSGIHPQSLEKLLSAVLLIPNGVLSFHPHLERTLDASSNLGILTIEEEKVILRGLVRANQNTKREDAMNRIYQLGLLLDGQVEVKNGYPAWEYQEISQLREYCCRIYQEMYDRSMEVSAIHGGLECALMHEKRPDMDMVSIGPNLYDVHSPEEKAEIASLIRMWNYVIKLLDNW